MEPLILLAPDRYETELLARLEHARHRIVLAAMIIGAGPRMNRLLDAAEAALSRGVAVHLLLDVYTKTRYPWDQRPWHASVQETEARLERLKTTGARVSWVGRLGLNPFWERCHVKASVIDDYVFSFGGINLQDEAFETNDYMLGFRHPELAARLTSMVDQIGRDELSHPDARWPMGPNQTALLDSGRHGQSIIYDQACQLAAQARRVIYVSQYTPGHRLARLLVKTDCRYFYNPPGRLGFPFNASQTAGQLRYGIKNDYRHDRYIHAKFILFELKDGTKTLLSGSHNFSDYGIMFGTKEIAVMSTDEALWSQLHAFWVKRIS